MRRFFSLFFFVPCFPFFSQTVSLNKVAPADPNKIQFVKHTFYELGFNAVCKIPAWALYSLTAEHLKLATIERKGSFVKDPLLQATQAKNADYSSTGYDKGHLVPCEDMSFSEAAMKETFYYSNCVPQTTELNRGEWKVLEELVRNWAKDHGEVLVVTGPVIVKNLKTIGEGQIQVPNLFYKIILRHEEPGYKSISFLMPNSTSTLSDLQQYVCTIDSIEQLTGLDFFTELPDNLEQKFESGVELSQWEFNYHHSNTKGLKGDTAKSKQVPRQCCALTKKGKRCKRTTGSANGRCSLHGG